MVGMTVSLRYADARDVLRTIPDGGVDLIVTDPPYPVISGGAGNPGDGSPSGIIASNDGKITRHNDIDISEYAGELFRVLRDPGHCYVMVNMLNLWRFHAELTRVGFQVHNLLVWHKTNVTPNRWYMKNAEYVLFLRKGLAFPINDCGLKTVQTMRSVRERFHPTEKPIKLMQQWIEASSQPGETVLDPFMGAGSTAVAAHRVGRRFIGVEIDPEYYMAACRRARVMP